MYSVLCTAVVAACCLRIFFILQPFCVLLRDTAAVQVYTAVHAYIRCMHAQYVYELSCASLCRLQTRIFNDGVVKQVGGRMISLYV